MIEIGMAIFITVIASLMTAVLSLTYFMCRMDWKCFNAYCEGWRDASDTFFRRNKREDSDPEPDCFEEWD